MRAQALLVVLACSLIGCGGARPWEKLDLASLPTAQTVPEAKHVVLLDEEIVRFLPDAATGKAVMEETEHGRWKILRPRDEFHVVVHYQRALSRVTEFRARVIMPDGSERAYTREDALDRMVRSEELFSDFRALSIDMEQPPVGSVIEWEYTLVQSDPLYFGEQMSTRRGSPARLLRLSVEYPKGWDVEVSHHEGDTTSEETVASRPGWVARSWAARDVPAVEPEDAVTEWQPPMLAVRLLRWDENGVAHHGFQTPQELSKWTSDLFGPTPTPDREMKKVLETVLKDAPADPAERTRRLYDWVKNEIQYCAVEVGWGGWKPIPPSDVFRVRYGDCKGKAELLHTLLTAEGISSHPVLVMSHEIQPIPFRLEFVGNNFNHVIDAVDLPSGRLILDPTSHVPFGELPVSDQGADLLPVAPAGEPVMRAPVAGPEVNTEEEDRLDLTLDRSGALQGTVAIAARGAVASWLESRFREVPRGRQHRTVEQLLHLQMDTLDDPSLHQRASSVDPLELHALLNSAGTAMSSGNGLIFRVGSALGTWLPTLAPGPRTRSVWLGVPRTIRQHVAIALPEATRVAHLPDEAQLRCNGLAYRISYRTEGSRLIIERELRLERSETPPAEYADLQSFLQKLHSAEAQVALLEAKP